MQLKPCVLHGDLWSGNMSTVDGQPAIFDPAVYYGHSEAEFGMSWCAGFSRDFYAGYHEVMPEQPGQHLMFNRCKLMLMLLTWADARHQQPPKFVIVYRCCSAKTDIFFVPLFEPQQSFWGLILLSVRINFVSSYTRLMSHFKVIRQHWEPAHLERLAWTADVDAE